MDEVDHNLHRLHRMLKSMTALRRCELDLPDDYVSDPPVLFPYKLFFPKDGHWPLFTTSTVRNCAIGTKDIVTLLVTKIPSLRHLSFGNIALLDGQWERIVEYLRVSNPLSSLEIDLTSLVLHRGNESFIRERASP